MLMDRYRQKLITITVDSPSPAGHGIIIKFK